MISEAKQKLTAEALVGEDVLSCLYRVEDGFLKSRELSVDRFALDDDGYYLFNARLRVPTPAIVESHLSEDGDLVLQLDELHLGRRKLLLK